MTEITNERWQVPAPRLFIVHASEDERFVQGFLLPAVGLAQEEVLLSTKLELGAPIVAEIARGAVSPVTVVVMSPSFLACRWARFANELATHQSVESAKDGSSRVVLAKLVDCDVPLYSRFKVSLDFRAQERWEDETSRLREKLAAPAPARAVIRCPYPGMLAFEEKAAADFYGREAEVSQALTYVEAGAREIYVIGSSGSGKSSLVAAGVLPKLQHIAEQGGARYLVRKMRPGADPMAALASAFEVEAAEAAPVEWREAVSGLLARHLEHPRVVLFVDQLEELFTTAKAAAREAFERALLQLRGEERVVTLLTLRADFYGELINSALWEGSGRAPMRLDVKPLRGESLREAIEKPARGLGVYFEPVLVERLLQEVKHEAGGLPLLQDALVQLWRERTRGMLRLADYEGKKTGGQTGLAARVRHRADAALHELTVAQQQLARRVLLRLVQFGEGEAEGVTRRQQTRAALAAAGDEEDEVDIVIRHLADRRLVTTSEGAEQEGWAARVDLAHEVLLTAWPTLKDWIHTRREDEQRRRVLEGKAAEWVRSGRGRTRLLDVEEIVEARGWLTQEAARELGPSEDALALVAASEAELADLERQRQQAEADRLVARRRLTRFVLVALTVFSLVTSGLGLFLWRQWQATLQQEKLAQQRRQEAQQQRQEAQQQLGLNVLEQGRSLLVEQSKPMFAIPLLQQAISLGMDGSVLRTVLASLRGYLWRNSFFHRGPVVFAAFSPDGARVVTASDDHTARVWEVATGRALGAPLEHHDAVTSAAFSPDGARVVTASWDKTARVWEVATGRPLRAPLVHQAPVTSAAFSPDGARVVTASEDDTARVWEVATGRALGSPLGHQDKVTSAAFSSDGARVVTASYDHTARVWEVATGRPLGAPLVHQAPVTSAAFSPGGARVVTASEDDTARVWEVATGRPLGTPLVHQGWVRSAAFSPDGERVVTASADHTARVWEVATGRALGAPLVHQGRVTSAAFSPDGARVVTASADHTARVWEVATGRALGAPLVHQGRVTSAAFSPDGARVVTASADHTARVWEVATGGRLGAPLVHQGWVMSPAFSPDGARVVTASHDRTAQVWEVATGGRLGAPLEHQASVRSAAFSPDGARVVTVSDDYTARVWEAATGRRLGAALVHQDEVRSVAFSPDGTRVVTASLDNTARVWEAATGRPLGAALVHQDKVWSAAFSRDGARVVTASWDKTARVWEAATGGRLGAPLVHQHKVWSAAFSWDGARVVTASADSTTSADSTARVWEVATGRPLGAPLEHQGWVTSAAFSPDGARLVTASWDKTARVWEVATSHPLGAPLEHQAEVTSAAFSPDGARVVTASEDHTARVWEVATGRPLGAPLVHQGWVTSAAFSPDGARVVTASADGTARVWDVAETGSLAAWSAQAQSCVGRPAEDVPSLRCQIAVGGDPDDETKVARNLIQWVQLHIEQMRQRHKK